MRFLVTGHKGFAGSHLVEKLESEGHDVVNNRGGDVDWKGLKGFFDLGAHTGIPESFNTPVKYFDNNAFQAVWRIERLVEKIPKCQFMYCSTSEVYGVTNQVIYETTPLKPMNPYAVSKTAADMYVQERTRNGFLNGFITRAFAHTGAGRPANFSISSDARQIARIILGKQEPVIKVGNLESKRVVMDVRDTVDVYYQLMMKRISGEMPNGEIYNICGSGEPVTIGSLLDIMLDKFDIKAELVKDPALFRPIDIPVQYPNCDKVRAFLGWEPKIPIETTLVDLVNYWIERVQHEGVSS